jgi:hypothetical protein
MFHRVGEWNMEDLTPNEAGSLSGARRYVDARPVSSWLP